MLPGWAEGGRRFPRLWKSIGVCRIFKKNQFCEKLTKNIFFAKKIFIAKNIFFANFSQNWYFLNIRHTPIDLSYQDLWNDIWHIALLCKKSFGTKNCKWHLQHLHRKSVNLQRFHIMESECIWNIRAQSSFLEEL